MDHVLLILRWTLAVAIAFAPLHLNAGPLEELSQQVREDNTLADAAAQIDIPSEDLPSQGDIIEEETMPDAEVQSFTNSEQLKITLSTGQVFFIPNPKVVDGMYKFLNEPTKETFHRNREHLLEKLAILFTSKKLGYGTGLLIKKTLIKAKRASVPKGEVVADLIEQTTKSNSLSIEEKRNIVIQSILEWVDQDLWENALEAARNDEFGIAIYLSGLGGVGMFSKTAAGKSGVGFTLGFNTVTQSMIYDTFFDARVIDRATGLMASISANVHVFTYYGSRNKDSHIAINFNHTDDYINQSMGVNPILSAVLHFPIPTFGGGTTVERPVFRGSLLNAMQTKLIPGYIKVKNSPKLAVYSVKNYIKKFLQFAGLSRSGQMCQNIFE